MGTVPLGEDVHQTLARTKGMIDTLGLILLLFVLAVLVLYAFLHQTQNK
jgi:hypothetical protein